MGSIQNIPTNVITGFLGVGKSTAIMHLLKSKPTNERWAVLVNEFGEVGIDGGFFSGNASENDGIFVREVPGGCMCCAAGLPMQIALNMLLAKAKPDRLLIEPTGLGHPKEVLSTLSNELYTQVLDVQKTVTLVDARKLKDERYLNNQTFRQQIEIADLVVANKADLYSNDDFPALQDYLAHTFSAPNKTLEKTENGQLKLEWLEGPTQYHSGCSHHHHEKEDSAPIPLVDDEDFPEQGYLSVDNQGEGFYSKGWVFKPEICFDRNKLYDLLVSVEVERLKAIFITSDGIVAFNQVDSVLTDMMIDESNDSRIELISNDKTILDSFESRLLACIN